MASCPVISRILWPSNVLLELIIRLLCLYIRQVTLLQSRYANMEQIGDFECQQQIVERCSSKSAAKKEEMNVFEELMQFCDVSIDENLNEVRN